MRRRRPAPPLWFDLLVVVTIALVVRHVTPAPAADAPQLAWWQIFIGIISLIWDGIQAAGQYVLAFLSWSLQMLWKFATQVYNGLIAVGTGIQGAGKSLWGFFKTVYDDVLKPAWVKFWTFVQWAKDTLVQLFKPILKFLNELKTHILDFYKKWVKPALDTIELARKVLKVLETLHLEWAKKLDAELADLERRIYEPFRLVLQKVNEVINAVNRVMTADGLFQRLALIKSIERDVKYIQQEFVNARKKPLTVDDVKTFRDKTEPKSNDTVLSELVAYLDDGGGDGAAVINEAIAQQRIYLKAL